MIASISLVMAMLNPPEVAADRGRIEGVVLTEAGPVAGASVLLTRLDPKLGALSYSTLRSTLTEDDGRFSFDRVGTGTWILDSHGARRVAQFPVLVRVTRDAPDVRALTLALKPAGTIQGVVRDEDGRALHGVRVAVGDDGLQGTEIEPVAVLDHATGRLLSLPRTMRYPRLPLEITYTDAHGRFQLSPVLPDEEATLQLGGFPPYHDRRVRGIMPGDFVDLVLDRGASIVGRVLDDDGPITGARVTLRMVEPTPGNSWIVIPRDSPRFRGATGSTSLVVGDDGHYRMEGLHPGHYLVMVDAADHSRGLSPILAVTGASEVIEQDVHLGASRRIAGRLVGDARARSFFPKARLLMRAENGVSVYLEDTRVPVADDGSFEIGQLSAESYTLSVEVPGVPSFALDRVRPGTTDLLIEVPPGRTVDERDVKTPVAIWPIRRQR